MTIREQVAQQALALPPEDRIYVVDILEQSLATDGFATPEIAREWAAEIDRRIDACDRGITQTSDARTALERIRQRLADHQARKVAP